MKERVCNEVKGISNKSVSRNIRCHKIYRTDATPVGSLKCDKSRQVEYHVHDFDQRMANVFIEKHNRMRLAMNILSEVIAIAEN